MNIADKILHGNWLWPIFKGKISFFTHNIETISARSMILSSRYIFVRMGNQIMTRPLTLIPFFKVKFIYLLIFLKQMQTEGWFRVPRVADLNNKQVRHHIFRERESQEPSMLYILLKAGCFLCTETESTYYLLLQFDKKTHSLNRNSCCIIPWYLSSTKWNVFFG